MKKSVLLFLSAVMVMSLCSCGNNAGSLGSQQASGSAVTGSAIVKEEMSDKVIPESLVCSKKSPYRNSDNYYEETENGCKQRKPDGTLVRKISFPGKAAVSLLSVTDSEIFYVKYGASDGGWSGEELWSIPIEKTADGDKPLVKNARFILKDEMVGWAGYFYADADYIVHIVPYSFKVFDRKTGKYRKLEGEPQDKKCPPNCVTYFSDCVCGNNIFFQCKYSGLYMYTLGSDKIIPVDTRTHGSYCAVAYEKENQIIYERCDVCEEFDEKKEGHQTSWYRYDCTSGKSQKLVTEDVWQKVFRENGIKDLDSPWGYMYIDGDMLYSICYDGYGFCFDLQGDHSLHYEKKFSEWLKKSKYKCYDVSEVENGKCYFTDMNDDEEEYIAGYYDLKKNTFVKTDKIYRY